MSLSVVIVTNKTSVSNFWKVYAKRMCHAISSMKTHLNRYLLVRILFVGVMFSLWSSVGLINGHSTVWRRSATRKMCVNPLSPFWLNPIFSRMVHWVPSPLARFDRWSSVTMAFRIISWQNYRTRSQHKRIRRRLVTMSWILRSLIVLIRRSNWSQVKNRPRYLFVRWTTDCQSASSSTRIWWKMMST